MVAVGADVAHDMMGFIEASPTPYHAVHNVAARLTDAGFEEFDPHRAGQPGARFVVRDGGLVAWFDGEAPGGTPRLLGAHTDSPNLRIRPRPDLGVAGFRQLAVEVYGGALLNSWLDRDLGLAGRVAVRDGSDVRHVLVRSDGPVLRVPQLAIHLDRGLNDKGLRLDPQAHLTPVWGLGDAREGAFVEWLAAAAETARSEVLGWDVACFDTLAPALIGPEGDLLASARLDNLCSTFGALEALLALRWAGGGPGIVILHDHEEVGSTSTTGADSAWAASVLEQRSAALGWERVEHLRWLESGALASADMAHATHPNHVGRHEPNHLVRAGGGPVIKHNENQRYATDGGSAARFRLACEDAGVPVQDYSHRGDLPCGSTIGPLSSARLALDTVDVGMAQLSMHSAREVMATDDVSHMVAAFSAWLRGGGG